MKKLLNAALLVSGTAIGAGLIALPMSAVNLGIGMTSIIILFMIFVAYQSSMMTIRLNHRNGAPLSIVELSRKFSGNIVFGITLTSFYLLSFSLLTAYFFCFADTIITFFELNRSVIIVICGLILLAILRLNVSVFSNFNSMLVAILLGIIMLSLLKIKSAGTGLKFINLKFSEIPPFLLIIFTSLGVQNVCHNVYEYLEHDVKKTQQAFLIGIIIPAIVYTIWIACILQVATTDSEFYHKLQLHIVSIGELIQFLCKSSHSASTEIFLKILMLFAIITSAIGMALGVSKSVQTIISSKKIANSIVCLIPVILSITIPNVFMNILSFGSMIATVFVIFIPYYLTQQKTLKDHICCGFGILVMLCEFIHIFHKN